MTRNETSTADRTAMGLAIKVDGLGQQLRLIHKRPTTLRQALAHALRSRDEIVAFDALADLSFSVAHGEVVGIIGRNGSGKTTLLRVLAGVYRPTSGSVRIDGKAAAIIELGAGFHPELTGRENIALNGLLLGASRAQMRDREAAIVEFADLGSFIDSPVKQYSAGMYMRLAFATATEIDPDVLLVDEVLAAGDAGFQARCVDRMRSFKERGRTIVVASHDTGFLSDFCDRLLLLHGGRLVAEGEPATVIERYDRLLTDVETFTSPYPEHS